MKIEDILKNQGYSDTELASISTLLQDQRFRGSLEAGLANLETERDAFKARVAEVEEWREKTAIPKIDQFARNETEARTRAAALEEQIKIAKEYGYLPREQAEDPQVIAAREAAARAQQGTGNQPAIDAKNFLTRQDADQFAQVQGMAMANFTDSAEEYRILYGGKSLYEYQNSNGARGMAALLAESQIAKVPLKQYIETKFGFQAKRDEQSAAARKAAEDAIRADERSKVAAELGNPALRNAMPSRHPLIPPKPKEGGMPWEHTSNELKERRLASAMKSILQ